jgi:hypothetical protein
MSIGKWGRLWRGGRYSFILYNPGFDSFIIVICNNLINGQMKNFCKYNMIVGMRDSSCRSLGEYLIFGF